jgi:beta-1,4-N-acetylglucosaminyltransferase
MTQNREYKAGIKKNKICLAASGGGHLTELLRLSDSWQNYETFFVTTVPVVRDDLKESGNVYIVGECNRQHLKLVILVLIRCMKIIYKEKPDIVISTGAAAGCMICFLAKILGARIVWIDSITNVKRISLSGRMVRYIADLFLVQWPELLSKYQNVEFAGTLI